MIAQASPRRTALDLGIALLASLLFFGLLGVDPARAQENDDLGFENGEVVVKLDLQQLGPNPDCRATIEEIRGRYNATVEDRLIENPGIACIYLLQLPQGSNTENVAGEIAGDVRVVYAEPNYTTDAPEGSRFMRARADSDPTTSSDSAPYRSQYAVEAVNLNNAHKVSEGTGTTVAVLDTGVQYDHPELAGSLVSGYDFADDDSDPADEGNGADDDSDTFVDEAVGHGTHVSGIVHLAAPEAGIMPLRVLDSDGTGNAFLIAEAVQYAVDNGADVINLSLSTSQESELVGDVLEDLRPDDDDDDGGDALENVPTEGVFVAASAGNEGNETLQYPAAEEGVTAVAAVDEDEKKTDFSSYGSSWVDVAAPGDDVYSTFTEGRYAEWDGTSMAAPFVAGQAALIRGLDPCYDAVKVEDRILSKARPLSDATLGKGHADAGKSVEDFQPENRDCTRPETAISSGPADLVRDATPTVVVSGSDDTTTADNLEFSYMVDGGTWSDYSSDDTITLGPLKSGRRTFYVKARDGEKNVDSSPALRTFTVDAVAPAVTSLAPPPGSRTRDRTPTIRATVGDSQTNLQGSNVRLYVDGRRKTAFSYNAATDRLSYASGRLSYGRHTVKVVAVDAAGNAGSRTWSFTVGR